MDMTALSAAWDSAPDFNDDASNDYRERVVAIRNARSKARGIIAECGTCERILDSGRKAHVKHAAVCADRNRTRAYGTL
jgi:hypothetical protein